MCDTPYMGVVWCVSHPLYFTPPVRWCSSEVPQEPNVRAVRPEHLRKLSTSNVAYPASEGRQPRTSHVQHTLRTSVARKVLSFFVKLSFFLAVGFLRPEGPNTYLRKTTPALCTGSFTCMPARCFPSEKNTPYGPKLPAYYAHAI